jgi:hypothetical protein
MKTFKLSRLDIDILYIVQIYISILPNFIDRVHSFPRAPSCGIYTFPRNFTENDKMSLIENRVATDSGSRSPLHVMLNDILMTQT